MSTCTVPDCPSPLSAKGYCGRHYQQAKAAARKREEFVPKPPAPAPQEDPFVVLLKRYRDDPVLFCQEILKVSPDPWQEELLRAIASGERRCSVRSGHGVGKSSCASWAVLWFFLTRYPCKVVITAPTSSQLFDALFAELKRWIKELPQFFQDCIETTTDRVYLKASPTEAFISARTSSRERPEALQGVHSDHVMLVCDEASGIPEEVFEAASGSMSGEHAVTLLLGNPTRTSGLFFRTHHDQKDQWFHRRVSCLDSPRVSKDFIEELKQRYGENSSQYAVRVEGNFPLSGTDSLIGRGVVQDAMKRDIVASPTTPTVWGLDVSRFGGDRTALCMRQGPVVTEIRTWKGLDLMETCGLVVNEYNSLAEAKRPAEILIDSIGIGSGVVDRLLELGLPARGINVSETGSILQNTARLRDSLWVSVRDWLDARNCKLPESEELLNDLTAPGYSFLSNGKLKVEGKSELKSRGIPSPDLADALCLTFASSAATMTGGNQRLSWGKPLHIDTDWVV